MAQPVETKENNDDNIDSERVYCTNALIKKVGKAVAVSLSDATLPGMAKNKHMTIFFRSGGRWSDDEISLISKETDSWIKQKYGSNKAPVTFNINNWGKKSVKIEGDLEALCHHLRNKFSSMSSDEQRIPHCELFKGHNGRNGRNRRNSKNGTDKTCHICGESGHFKRNCPQKQHKKDRKYGGKGCHICGETGHFKKNCPQKYGKKDKKDKKEQKGKHGNTEKVKQRLERMISKMNGLREKKQREIELLDEEEKQLKELLNNADNLDHKTLQNEIKKIAKSFRNKRKQFKGRKNKKIMKRISKRFNKKERKNEHKKEKKEFKQKRKEEKRLKREERKRFKKEKLDNLSAARLDILPFNKTEIGNNGILNIYVDGYNVVGCDSICRRNMRGKGGGMKKSRSRLAGLLQDVFLNNINSFNFDYKPIVYLWFDGNGKNTKYGDIEITFSTKKQIVDDKLVEKFSKNSKKENENILVITTDKELTLRLHRIGVKVMKSSTFYKTYLKEKKDENSNDIAPNPTDDNDDNNDNNNDDEKKEEFTDDDYVQIIANKMNSMQYEDKSTTDEDDEDDEGDYTPDEIEGSHQYETPEFGEEEDYEFTSIFGEDMDIIDDED